MKWEYMYVDKGINVWEANEMTAFLNEMGNDGWELVTLSRGSAALQEFVFKRSK